MGGLFTGSLILAEEIGCQPIVVEDLYECAQWTDVIGGAVAVGVGIGIGFDEYIRHSKHTKTEEREYIDPALDDWR